MPLSLQLMYFVMNNLIGSHCKNWQSQLRWWWMRELKG